MKRRSFIAISGAASAALSGSVGCENTEQKTVVISVPSTTTLAGKKLSEIRERYRYDLFDDFLPFLDAHVIDHEYGGFMCNTDRDGAHITENKRCWYEGRGVWVYSFLYNNFEPDPRYLDIAGKSVKILEKNDPGRNKFWPENYDRKGKPIGDPDMRGYGNLFVANGYAEYAKAVKDDSYRDRAKEIMLDFIEYYDRPDYQPEAAQSSIRPEAPLIPGARVQGVWMVLVRLSSQMLTYKPDNEIEAVARRCVDAIVNHHFNPNFDLINEIINHDMSRPDNEIAQFVYPGHAMETLWMLMYEAVRTKDKELFFTAAEWFRRHFEVAWDDVYGGVFSGLKHVDNNEWMLSKALWAQEEVLVGSLCIMEHTGEQWAKDIFEKMYAYVYDKFPLKQYGFPIWILAADRKVTFERHYSRVGNFHHPRHLMLNMLALDRMIERKGKVSGLFG
ncbi:MAG: AGE family epimerase/isomerase [Candidatus Latescibacteria bacterium]|nr:AGE family epimerase/isomerase [Candidatus Latescibacterota bacterium]